MFVTRSKSLQYLKEDDVLQAREISLNSTAELHHKAKQQIFVSHVRTSPICCKSAV